MSGTDVWWEELCRAIRHRPHPPVRCVSIASSSPIALWQCPNCYWTQLARRDCQPVCEGGYPWNELAAGNGSGSGWGTRTDTLAGLPMLGRFSRETASREAYEYHLTWISTHTQV